ncbi:hypothetical protein JCM10449v2_004738 [Rhodotorula kratochvilovae]
MAITALPPLELTSAAIPPTLRQRTRRLQKRPPAELPPRPSRPASVGTEYTPDQRYKIEKKVEDGAWRRYGMIASNAALFVLWLVVFLFLHGVFGSFKFVQTTCEDPNATELLTIASIALLCLSVVVFGVCVLSFYSHILHKHLRRILDYSREPRVWTQIAVPAVFSGVVFAVWLTLLWTSYELAAQPSSSLLAESEQSATFATILSIALVIKPICDLIKALFKHYRRRSRLAKAQQKKRTSAHPAGPPPSPRTSSAHSKREDFEKSSDFEKNGSHGPSGSETLLPSETRASRSRSDRGRDDDEDRPPSSSASRSSSSTSGEFSRTSSQAERADAVSSTPSPEDSTAEEARQYRARRKRTSLRKAVVRREHERGA